MRILRNVWDEIRFRATQEGEGHGLLGEPLLQISFGRRNKGKYSSKLYTGKLQLLLPTAKKFKFDILRFYETYE